MRPSLWRAWPLAALALGLASASEAKTALRPKGAAPSFKKVLVIVLENANYADALGQKFLSELTRSGALLTNYHAVSHPSQPNYVAMTAGTDQGVDGDGNVDLDERHVGDLLEDKGRTWKVYAEGYPGGCFLDARSGKYVRKHTPFLSFVDVQSDPKRCANVVEASALAADAAAGGLPDYAFYVPDLDDDGHDTDVAAASAWLEKSFGPRFKDPAFMKDLLVVVTFDEDEFLAKNQSQDKSGNQVYAALLGGSVLPGAVSNDSYTHYSLLRTIEDGLGLGTLGKEDAKASPIAGIWR